MTDLDLFFDSSRDVAMATSWSKKNRCFFLTNLLVALPFRNALQYRNSDFKRLNIMIFLDRSSNPWDYESIRIAPFWIRWQNIGIFHQISFSATTAPIIIIFSALVDISMITIKQTRCYGNQLILRAFCKRQNWLPSLFALAFDNGLADR